jgi:hypothetical protein
MDDGAPAVPVINPTINRGPAGFLPGSDKQPVPEEAARGPSVKLREACDSRSGVAWWANGGALPRLRIDKSAQLSARSVADDLLRVHQERA